VKALAGRARDIGASQVGGTASMRIGRSGIGQVLDDAEVLLVTLQWRKSLGQLIQCARFGGIKSLLGETVTDPAKDHPRGRLGQSRGRGQRVHALEPGQGKQGTSGSQKVSSIHGG
jgi:hypothetical protein